MSGTLPLDMTLLLAAAAYRTAPTAEAWEALLLGLQRQPYATRFLDGHAGPPERLAVSGDGTCAAASTEDRITVWDLATGKVRAGIRVQGARPAVHALTPGCGALALGLKDGTVQIWNLGRSPVQRWSASGSGKPVSAIAMGARHGRVAASDLGGRLVLLSLDTGQLAAEIPESRGFSAKVLRFDEGGTVLAGVSERNVVRRWSADALVARGEPVTCLGEGFRVALSSDLNRCAVAGDPPGGATVTNLSGPKAPEAHLGGPWIVALDFTHDGRSLITAVQGGAIQVWDLTSAKRDAAGSPAAPTLPSARPAAVLAEHRMDVTTVAASPDGRFVSGARDGKVIVWRLSPAARLVKEIPNRTEEFAEAALDSSLRRMATANANGDLYLADLDPPAAPAPAGSAGERVSALAIREPDAEIFAATATGDVVAFEPGSRRRRLFAKRRQERIERLRFDAAGSRLAAVSENGTVIVWNVAGGKLLAAFPGGKPRKGRAGGITASVDIAFDPEGNRLASVHGDPQAFLWTWTGSGFRYDPFPLKPASYFTAVAFGPGGSRIALGTGIYEGSIALFDALNTKPPAALPAGHHEMDVTALAFSPDGRLLLSGGFDATVSLWDFAARRRIGDAYRVPGPVDLVAFAPNGLAAAAVTDGGTVVRWDLDPAHWLEMACRVANRDLSAEERIRLLGSPGGEPACPALPDKSRAAR
jgi:WD40 repeat protein